MPDNAVPIDAVPFDPAAITRAASDVLSVRRVFGEAYERGGALVIPVAKILGGTGNGSGTGSAGGGAGEAPEGSKHGPHGQSEGSGGGGGFAARVRPVGVYVIDDSGVHWRPALDVNRVILGGQAAVIMVSLALAWALRRRRR